VVPCRLSIRGCDGVSAAVHVTGSVRPAEALEDSPDIPAQNAPPCLRSWPVLQWDWSYLNGAHIADRQSRLLLRVGQ
jgi:hypothetical protein